MATVYSAYDPEFDRKVAIKVMPKELMKDPQFVERFNREARTVARLEHSSIVAVYDYGQQDGQPYLVMRYMAGGNLKEYLIQHGPFSVQQAAALLSSLAPALDKSHAEGIVHRDVKPANILFDEDGNPYLSDFGIVKLSQADITLTGTHDTIGTPAYMSPEQARTQKDLDGRSDIYSLAVILFELLTGEQPFKADTPIGMAVAHIQDPIPHITERRGDLPDSMQRIIDRGLAKERNDRYSSSQELVDALRNLASKIERGELETIDALVTGLKGERLSEKHKIPRWVWIIVGGLVFVGISLVCVAAVWFGRGFVTQNDAIPQVQTQIIIFTETPGEQVVAPLEQSTSTPEPTVTSTHFPTATQTSSSVPTETPVAPRISNFIACPGTCTGTNATREFTEAITKIDFRWDYENIPYGAKYERIWSMDGREWAYYSCAWSWESNGIESKVTLTEPDGLHSGPWQVRILVDGVELMREEFIVTGNWTYWDAGGDFDDCYGKR